MISHTRSPIPIGSADHPPGADQELRADVGLWIGLPYHGKGYGTLAVRWLVDYGFTRLGLEKIEASIYTGNWASRRIFEKNGFILEGTIRKATLKRGQWQDDWRVGITREDYQQDRLQDPRLPHHHPGRLAGRPGQPRPSYPPPWRRRGSSTARGRSRSCG